MSSSFRYAFAGSSSSSWKMFLPAAATAVVASGAVSFLMTSEPKSWKHHLVKPVLAEPVAASVDKDKKVQASTPVEQHRKRTIQKRFESFASHKYKGNPVMTPIDFLESVTQVSPRPRVDRIALDDELVKLRVKSTPAQSKNTKDFFRKCDKNGVISFAEYCFLISCLTKSRGSFKIAFNMFDRDDNERIDKSELDVLTAVISGVFDDVSHLPTSTISNHFFGAAGNKTLAFNEFSKFVDNLQTEILEIEFFEYSKGLMSISEVEFARILLRHTMVEEEKQDLMLENLIKGGSKFFKGVSFEDFKAFFQFLNNLDDFTVAISMYGFAGQPLSEEAFQRAYKITTGGREIPTHVLKTLYTLFDADNDGKLSKREFIGVMKDAVQRGFRYSQTQYNGYDGYKECLRNEMKLSSRKL